MNNYKLLNNLKLLNYDVDNIIIDYIYQLIHRDKFNILKDQLLLKAIKKLIKLSPPFMLLEYYGKDWCKFAFDILYNCKCCKIHQINKPNKIDLLNGYVPDYETSPFKNECSNKCNCSCRHDCRMICREINDPELE